MKVIREGSPNGFLCRMLNHDWQPWRIGYVRCRCGAKGRVIR